MDSLALKVPPPVVFVVTAGAMWGISLAGVSLGLREPIREVAAAAIAVAGIGIDLVSAVTFRRASTTASPMKPEKSSALVTAGPYRFSRNPMYVGLLLILLAWAMFLDSAFAFAGPLAFVLYIDRFQIRPEERVLGLIFGQAYTSYKARVRRWL